MVQTFIKEYGGGGMMLIQWILNLPFYVPSVSNIKCRALYWNKIIIELPQLPPPNNLIDCSSWSLARYLKHYYLIYWVSDCKIKAATATTTWLIMDISLPFHSFFFKESPQLCPALKFCCAWLQKEKYIEIGYILYINRRLSQPGRQAGRPAGSIDRSIDRSINQSINQINQCRLETLMSWEGKSVLGFCLN